MLFLLFSLLIFVCIFFLNLNKNILSPLVLKENPIYSSKVLDRKGELLFRFFDTENRTPINLKDVSPNFIKAILAIEDQDFYSHYGFSLTGIIRSVWHNLNNKNNLRGGSTITQQLVKNRLLSSSKNYRRKLQEVLLAIKVERMYSKDQILELYLNQIAFGGTTYGIEEAAWYYFDKSAKELSIAESAMLAGLPQAPSEFNPKAKNPEKAYNRMHSVLERMLDEGYINHQEFDEAKSVKFAFNNEVNRIKAPHFVMYIKDLLIKKYGKKRLNEGGLIIKTSLDLELHDETQQIVTNNVKNLFRLLVGNGAALVTNPKTGEILSMVGSKDYFDIKNDGNVNVTIRLRQPGSSIKPLTYAMALENGKTPETNLQDTPAVYYSRDGKKYAPRNNDYTFKGRIPLRQALGSSYNLPAVKELAQIGVLNYIKKARSLGINTWNDKDEYDFGLTLGGGEVRMLDMAQLFSTFANFGYDVAPNPIIEITDYDGNQVYKNNCIIDNIGCRSGRKFSDKTMVYLTDILSDNDARFKTFGAESDLQISDHKIAVKTGTTNQYRDNWTIGYITNYVVVVWIGNNKNTPMRFIRSGVRGASNIWRDIMINILDGSKPHRFNYPGDFIKIKVCEGLGTLPCSVCTNVINEIFERGKQPQQACNGYFPM